MTMLYLIIAAIVLALFADSVWQFWRGWRTGQTRQLGLAGLYNDVQLDRDDEDDRLWFLTAMIVRGVGAVIYPLICAGLGFKGLAEIF